MRIEFSVFPVNRVRHAAKNGIWSSLALLWFFASCATAPVVEPPAFDYPNLLNTFFQNHPGGHFPIIIQKGMNSDPSVSEAGYLFYVSDSQGSPDIWMRQLRTTVNVPVVIMESVQNSPAISTDGQYLAYVSYDSDPSGDILLTRIDPERIAEDALRGNAIPNHSASSLRLSDYIAARYRDNPHGCAGAAAEMDPVFSADGRTLFYASDRCERGVFRLWRLLLDEKGRPEGRPELVSSARAMQPSVTGQTLVATALNDRGLPDGFLFISLKTGKTEHIPFRNRGIALRPILSSDEKDLFFMLVAKDTNGDGRLDLNDRGAVYRMSLKNRSLHPVTDGSMPVYNIARSSYLGGGILYAGYDQEAGRSRIYLSLPDGLIPRKGNALEQYELARSFSGAQKQLALESVLQYFSGAPEFFLVQYDVLADLRNGALERPDRQRYDEEIERILKENAFAPAARTARAGTPAAIQRALRSSRLQDLDEAARRLAISYLRERLAESWSRAGQLQRALETLQILNREDPGYINRNDTVIRETVLTIRLYKGLPDHIRELLSASGTDETLRQQLIRTVYEEVNRKGTPLPDPASESQPVLRGLYYIMQGERLFRARRYGEAREHIQKGLEFTGEGNVAYTIGWKLLAAIYDIEQNQPLALNARLRFLTSYQREWDLDVDEADFLRLIDSSRSYIETYRRSAQSVAEDVEDRLDYRFFLISEIQTAVLSDKIQLNMVDRNMLVQFCAPGSAAGLLIQNLRYQNYIERYAKLCRSVSPYIEGKTNSITLEQGHEVSQLFYLVSYANATLVNILFLQFKAAGLFEDLHKTWSVYYHRWKTDLAIERLNRQLIWEEKRSQIISKDTVQSLFLEKDPFDAKIFEEILVGYQFAEEDARRHFDHSLLYGHAYLLIRKSAERERFYDSLLKKGVQIPSSVMAERKKAILDDLKQAEYRLQYILNVDPGFVDATLLLSWLYQYIDNRKQSEVLLEPGYIDRAFILLTGIRPNSVRDGIFYRAEYQNTFNGRYYEKNVDMLNAAIEEIRHSGRARDLSLLYLNLGNNLFQLVNYRAAGEAYDRAEQLARQSQASIFENDMQRILFHINRGRARFYSGQAGAAAADFDLAVELLRKTDYWPNFEAANRAFYRAQANPNNAYLKARSDRKQAELLQSRYRLAFAQSLRGLAHQDSGHARKAIQAYSDALQILYGREPYPPQGMDRAGLENYIAMAFQELEDFDRSDRAAREAEASARERGLSRNDSRFQPQTVGGRILGLLLGYGEDFSVIGEGRTPYGFSPLRQFELSLGIRFRNAMGQGDLDRAVDILARRIEVFNDRDGDVRLGHEGKVYSLNQRAEIALYQRNYRKAFEDYRTAAEAARKSGMLDSFRLNFRNSYIVLFQQFEATEGEPAINGQLKSAMKDLIAFRENYRDALKDLYIKQRETEDPDFTYSEERDDPQLERLMVRDLSDFAAIEGLLAFYLHLQAKREGKTGEMLRIAEDRLLQASAADEGAPTLAGIRTRLNLARVLLEKRDLTECEALLDRIDEETYEFHAVPERFVYLRIRSDLAASGKHYEKAIGYLNQAMALLKEHPFILPLVEERIASLFQKMAELHIRLNRPDRALQVLEQARLYRLQLEFYRYPLEFSNNDATEIHRILRQSQARMRALLAEETRLRLLRRDAEEVIRLRQQEQKRYVSMQKEMLLAEPSLKDFIAVREVSLPSARSPYQYVRLFSTPLSRYCIRLFKGRIDVSGTVESCGLSAAPSIIVSDWRSASNGMLARLLQSVGSERVLRTTMSDTSSVMIRSPSDIADGYRFFNIRSTGPAAEENVLHVHGLPASHFFARRSGDVFSAADWVGRKRYAALALVRSPSDDLLPTAADDTVAFRTWWDGMLFSYEVFRATGGGIFLLYQGKPPADPSLFGTGNSLAFGTQGFDRSALQSYLIERHRALMTRGLKLLAEDRSAALRAFEMADSLLEGIPDEEAIGAKNRLHLARSLILVRPDEGEKYFREILNREKRRRERFGIYRSFIGGLASVGRYQKALAVYEESLKEFPEREAKEQPEKIVLEYLNDLNRSEPSGPVVYPEEVLLALFRNRRSLVNAGVQLLYRHGSYDLAEALQNRHGPRSKNPRIALESALLQGEGIDEAIAVLENSRLSEEDTDLKLILSAYRGRWKYVEDLLGGTAVSVSRAVFEQRRLLFRQMRQKMQEGRTGLDSLTCLQRPATGAILLDIVPFRQRGTKNESACARLSQTEQVLLFRMALDSIPFDGHGQVKTVLRQLIDGVKSYSSQRASLFALLAAKAYLLDRRPAIAAEFMQMHASLSGGRPVPAFLARTQAFTALWLTSLGWKVPENVLVYSMQNEYGASLFHRLAPILGAAEIDHSTIANTYRALQVLQLSYDDAYMALFLLQEKAAKAGKAGLYLDLLVAEKRMHQGRDWRIQHVWRELQKNLPAGQHFSVLHDNGTEFRLIQLTATGIGMSFLDSSSVVLRSRLLEYYQSPGLQDSAVALSGEYDALLPVEEGGLHYVWLPGVHSLAPLSLSEQVMQILDPEPLASSPKQDERFQPGRIRVKLGPTSGSLNGLYRRTLQQLVFWTNLELQSMARPKAGTAMIQEGWQPVIGMSSWIIFEEVSRPVPDLTPGRKQPSLARFGVPPGTIGQGIGIIGRMPYGGLALIPGFVKAYIKADLPAVKLWPRFQYARRQIQEGDGGQYLFIKPATASFIHPVTEKGMRE